MKRVDIGNFGLLSCWMCGSKEVIIKERPCPKSRGVKGFSEYSFTVSCKDCGNEGGCFKDRQSAVSAWNRAYNDEAARI